MNEYKHSTMVDYGMANLVQRDLVINTMFSKVKCLENAGKEANMTMYAIEKDDDYLPTFKTCVKDQLATILQKRSEKFSSLTPAMQ